MNHIPILETSRLKLRGHCKEDFEESAAMLANPKVSQYIGGKPSNTQASWSRLLNYIGHWSVMGFGYWVIEEKATGKFLGEAGFANFRREIDASMLDLPEAGWVLKPEFHGHGFAVEAVMAAHIWGEKFFAQKKSTCIIDPENQASIKLALKCGYRENLTTLYQEKPIIIFQRNF